MIGLGRQNQPWFWTDEVKVAGVMSVFVGVTQTDQESVLEESTTTCNFT
jgi:hypothetical protein